MRPPVYCRCVGEETVRDIIEGELTGQYVLRRRLLPEPWQRGYWDATVHGLGKPMEAIRKEIEKVSNETLGQLDKLVGASVAAEAAKRPDRSPQLSFLSEEKQRQIDQVNEKFNQLRDAVLRETTLDAKGRRIANPERQAKLKEIQQQRQAAILAITTPEEQEEYRLHKSPYVRVGVMPGFDATPEGLRAVTRVFEQSGVANQPPDPKAADYPARLAAQKVAKQQREEAAQGGARRGAV
jgi:hypothetical protein